MGLPRKRNYSGRWDVLIDMSTKCLNKLLEIAAKKNRNYILDQVILGVITFCYEMFKIEILQVTVYSCCWNT